MKGYRWCVILLLSFSILGCAKAGTYSLYIRYQPTKEFVSLRQKIGSTLGLAPFKDERPDTLFIGIHTPLQGVLSRFKSEPFPLEGAIKESLLGPLSRYEVKTVSISDWDGKPESLKNVEADSVFMIEIKKFWVEGKADLFRTKLKTSVHFLMHLGVKKEGKVFTRNVEVQKEATVFRFHPEEVEQTVNGILTEIFDSFLSDPY